MSHAATEAQATDTLSVTKTVKLQLQTSARKNAKVADAIGDWQCVAEYMATMLPSVDEHLWGRRHQQQNRLAKAEFDGLCIYAHDRDQAVEKVSEAFASWRENGKPSEKSPKGRFGDGNYLRMCSCSSCPGNAITDETGRYTIKENGGQYAIRLKFHRDGAEWFNVHGRPYVNEHLADIVSGEAKFGNAELRLSEGGGLAAHVTLTYEIPVHTAEAAETVVGVDLGERVMYAAAAIGGSGGVEQVELRTGGEFRHARERLKRKRYQLMEQDDLRGVKACRDEHRRYTDHVTHVASREIVDLAVAHQPAVIAIEELTGYREAAEDAIHDWPYAELRRKIAYKATEEGVPVVAVDPHGTSYTCSECGSENPAWRQGVEFACGDCGYEVHADVNAAKNIASAVK